MRAEYSGRETRREDFEGYIKELSGQKALETEYNQAMTFNLIITTAILGLIALAIILSFIG